MYLDLEAGNMYKFAFGCQVYGDTAQFTKEGDKFTALLLGFPLWKVKGWLLNPVYRVRYML